MNTNAIPVKKIIACAALAGVALFGTCAATKVAETVGAGTIVVKQGAIDGKLTVWNQPGLYGQWWGNLTNYKRSDQYSFGGKDDGADQSVQVRFNDLGHGTVSGSLRYYLPTDSETAMNLHMTYGSQANVEKQLIGKAVVNAIYMTGPLMSSTESASARRADLLSLAEDQLRWGIYKQKRWDRKEQDPITKQEKTVMVVELLPCTTGPLCVHGFERQERSPLDKFGIKVEALTYSEIKYEDVVEKQIARQQEATASIQEAMAHARKAEQQALTAQKEGEAAVAKAKAEKDVEKIRAVTNAEQEKEVALLGAQKDREVAEQDARAALAEKQAEILRGQGQAEAARLKMAANGSLAEKLAAWVKVNEAYAEALKAQPQVPNIVMGGSGPTPRGADLVDILKARAAQDLNLNFKPGTR